MFVTIMFRVKKCSLLIFGFIFFENNDKVTAKICEGGHSCSGPMTCCNKGCCYTNQGPGTMISSGTGTSRVYTGAGAQLLMPVHWYFWALLAACLAAIICLCALWRRRSVWSCCRDSSGQDRRSEPDSNGSLYAPPHYSRCSSFHHAPPPYTEVATKPDMYPLVISYGLGCDGSFKNSTANYLMVQYFHNYIFTQPTTGSISATSTVDSLSSNFICTSTNDANNIIPPPYSCTGSFDECSIPSMDAANILAQDTQNCTTPQHYNTISSTVVTTATVEQTAAPPIAVQQSPQLPAAAALYNQQIQQSQFQQTPINATEYYHNHHAQSSNGPLATCTNSAQAQRYENINNVNNNKCVNNGSVVVNPYFNPINGFSSENNNLSAQQSSNEQTSDLTSTHKHLTSNFCNQIIDEYEEERPTSSVMIGLDQSYSVANSITSGSDISSLTNLGTPNSPPRATSPTVEIRELLDKIQQLKSPTSKHEDAVDSDSELVPKHEQAQPKTFLRARARCFARSKTKTLYVPLSSNSKSVKLSLFDGCSGTTKRWLSRSAPATPCTTILPIFPSTSSGVTSVGATQRSKNSTSSSRRNSKAGVDGSQLLLEYCDSGTDNDDEERKSEHV